MKRKMKVIFIAPKPNIPKYLLDELSKHAEILFFEDNPINVRNIDELKQPGDKILCPFPEPMAWKFPNEIIPEIKDLKGICLSTTSPEWIDGKKLKQLGLPLTIVPNPPNAIAEAAIFFMFAVARRFSEFYKQDEFIFHPDNMFIEIQRKKMGIIGLGKIGSAIAALGKRLDMKVAYWSKNTRCDEYEYLELDSVMKTSDFVFVCIEVNSETKGLISKEMLDLMSSKSSLISIAHKGAIDRDYLVKKVESKEIFGCAFEDDEKSIGDYRGNVFITKHNNWYTPETMKRKMEAWFANITGVINGNAPNVAN